MSNLNQRVKELCALKGITLADLAVKMNVSASSLSQILNGNPTLAKIESIAAALEVEVGDLFAPQRNIISCPNCGTILEVIIKK